MSKEFIFDIVKFIVTATGTVVGLWFVWRNFKRQMNANTVMKYAERYEKVMDLLPPDARRVRFNLDEVLPPESEQTTMAALKYLNLCSEEFYLRKKGYLDKDVWSIWEGELKRTLRSRLFLREWEKLRDEFDSHSAFQDFVDEVQAEEPETNYGALLN